MIDRKQLLADLKPLLKELETDLRARCDEVPEIDAGLKQEYEQAREAGRTGAAFEAWRADLITQVAAAWVLSCVFVRFLEDNELISPPRISGPLHGAGEGRGMLRARDERDLFFRSNPTDTDRDYLLAVFDDLGKLPGAKDIFGPHNPVSAYRHWLSGDAAQKLIEFFQKIDKDETGELIHDFADPITTTGGLDTRFLGDLYQDLSEAARKKYALLQTPVFVEEFILERTLEPAINEFGLKGLKMIDPACGSGHFLLGAFTRILGHWRQQEPATPDRELVNRTLAAVHGVDLNPYAIAITRFRLLVVAMRESNVTRLQDAPAYELNVVCGDSLLHGTRSATRGLQDTLFEGDDRSQVLHRHVYGAENREQLARILQTRHYHVVVGNPPYITVKDAALNQAYRTLYGSCHRQYSLAVPFFERFFDLALASESDGDTEAGFVGQITANSFMKREFGKKLIEAYLPIWDLTHVIDTSGAYIPGHGTPTVILFGRHRAPVNKSIRAVLGIRGEPSTPEDPATAKVWSAILNQIDRPGSQGDFVSVSDTRRARFHSHPWSIRGGGAAELKELIERGRSRRLGDVVDQIGRTTDVGEDDIWTFDEAASRRRLLFSRCLQGVIGESVRDWSILETPLLVYPYEELGGPPLSPTEYVVSRYLWRFRRVLEIRTVFGKTFTERGKPWWEHLEHYTRKFSTPLSIAFALVATQNHFSFDRGGRAFKHSAPVAKLPPGSTEDAHLSLTGLLNSSTIGFWAKQVFHNKGSTVDQHGARQRTAPFEDFWEHDATKMKLAPIVDTFPIEMARAMDDLAQDLSRQLGIRRICSESVNESSIESHRRERERIFRSMCSWQEEIDWKCYSLYGLLVDAPMSVDPPSIKLGERAFEIVLARRMAVGEEETTWFTRHGSTPTTEVPAEWPEEYKRIVEKRIEIIESNRNVGLIEQPEYKRRWNIEPWEKQRERALRNWLLDRLERYFDLDGRMNDQEQLTAHATLREPRLTSIAQVADLARADIEFMQVAELYVGRMDFDVTNIIAELIRAESVPSLPALRYKPSGADKRSVWERTWDLQRLEDAVDAFFEIDRLKELTEAEKQGSGGTAKAAATLSVEEPKRQKVIRELDTAASYVAEATKQGLNLKAETVAKPIWDAANRAKKAAVGEIPVPPKYKRADFLDSIFWRLRGKLDVPKERWVSFPHCEGEDGTLVIAWAGYDHLQLARAIAERYELAKEQEGRKLVPLLAAIGQLIPWLKQWHNDLDPAYGTRMGDHYEDYLAEEAKAIGKSVKEVMAWTPPAKVKKTRKKRNKR